jgi:hypothetical protein
MIGSVNATAFIVIYLSLRFTSRYNRRMTRSPKRLFRKLLPAIALAVLAQSSSTQAPGVRFQRVEQPYVDAQMFMGSVLVAKDGKIIFSKSYGMAALEWNVPNSPNSILQRHFVGSGGEYRLARFFLIRQVEHIFYAMVFLSLAAAAGKAIDTSLDALREFLRIEPLLHGGKCARVRLDLETNTLFLVRLAEHVDVLANVGEHTFLAVGNDKLHLSHSIEKERDETRVKCLDVLGIERRHRNGLGELFLQQSLSRRIDDVDLV